jgi:hypothetical protein
MHSIIGKNGAERSTTLRDARKLNLLPSVTSILSILAKPGLEAWKQEQAILAALTLPRIAGENDDAFAARVVADMNAQVEKAGDFGTRIHAGIESINSGHTPNDPELAPWLEHYATWQRASIVRGVDSGTPLITAAETVVTSDGYAGRLDIVCEHAEHGTTLIDFKTQNVKNGKPQFYETWCAQLAAYRAALPEKLRGVHCLSLVIDSNTPAAPIEKLWTEDELATGLAIFHHARDVWQLQRGYKPAHAANAINVKAHE